MSNSPLNYDSDQNQLSSTIITWNIGVARTPSRLSSVINELTAQTEQPILLLTSTGCPPSIFQAITRQLLPTYSCKATHNPTSHRSGGTAILLPPSLKCRATPPTHFGGLVTLQTISTNPPTLIVCLYWPPSCSQSCTPLMRVQTIDFLRHHLTAAIAAQHHVIIGGDFNDQNSYFDASNVRHSHPPTHIARMELMHTLHLHDTFRCLHPTAREYTFPSNNRPQMASSRLDYIFVTGSLLPCITSATIPHLLGDLSDHHPASITLNCPTMTDKTALREQEIALSKSARMIIDYDKITSKHWQLFASEVHTHLQYDQTHSSNTAWKKYSKIIMDAAKHQLTWRKTNTSPKPKKTPTPKLDRVIKNFRQSSIFRNESTPSHQAKHKICSFPL